MSEAAKVSGSHRSRGAVIYVRQSTLAQVERNTESRARQLDLVTRAGELGWPAGSIRVVEDQGGSASVTGQRDGVEALGAAVALGPGGVGMAVATRGAPALAAAAGHYREQGAPRDHLGGADL